MNYLILAICVSVVIGDIYLCRKNFVWALVWLLVPVALGFIVSKLLWPITIILLSINIAFRMRQQEKVNALLSGKQIYRLQQREKRMLGRDKLAATESSAAIRQANRRSDQFNIPDLYGDNPNYLSVDYLEGRALKQNYQQPKVMIEIDKALEHNGGIKTNNYSDTRSA